MRSNFIHLTSALHRSAAAASYDYPSFQAPAVVSIPNDQVYTPNETLARGLLLAGQDKYTSVPSEPPSGSTLSFYNIDYIVGAKRQKLPYKKWFPACMKPKESRQILYDVSGMFKSGLNAIMGKNFSYSTNDASDYKKLFLLFLEFKNSS